MGRISAPIRRATALFRIGLDLNIHPLFDARFYNVCNPDVSASRWPPLLHFLIWGGFEGRKPHPLFDPKWYLSENADVAGTKLNPLQHYVNFGCRERRSPHPLFDSAWYVRQYPDANVVTDPLLDFLARSGSGCRRPHALFDSEWYSQRYPEVKSSGLNPLLHYVLHGAISGFAPNRHFNPQRYMEQFGSTLDTDALSHYIITTSRGVYKSHPGFSQTSERPPGTAAPTPLLLASTCRPGSGQHPFVIGNDLGNSEVPIFIVYGASHVPFIQSTIIPSLAAQSCRNKLRLHVLNYKSGESLLNDEVTRYSGGALTGIMDWSAGRDGGHIGFGEAMNYLFRRVEPESCFFLMNPDSIPMHGCMDTLLETFRTRDYALVEARQWPCEHPKEFDPATGWTPWASGAFVLVSSQAFQSLNGFDPLFFLYNEDVDLSWRAWLHNMPVVYEPKAVCAHFTGALSYHESRFYSEHFFSIRNFVVLAYKFFGEIGERAAWRWVDEARLPATLRARVEESYLALRQHIRRVNCDGRSHTDKVKILGMNLYHNLRQL